jgi:DNA-binding response OmpR family regulator
MASYRIIIVDDQREISRLLRSALETLEQEIEVVEIPSGEEAILDCSRNRVDLLVADYRLPGMTGLDLMKKVRQNTPNLKVILITGQSDPKVRKMVSDAGADAFFIKPIPMAEFLDAVERHLGMVETFLPPEPILAEITGGGARRSLPDLLSGLRQETEASAVLLLNDSGHVLARAGDLPDVNDEVSLLSSLLSIFSAGQKISRLLAQKKFSGWSIFNGGDYDLIFTPTSEGYAILTIGQGLAAKEHALKNVNIIAEVRAPIDNALHEKIEPLVAIKTPRQAPAEAAEASGKEMEPLLKESKKKLKPAEVDEFWNKAARKHKTPAKPDMLSYDQAKQLGLTPEEKG